MNSTETRKTLILCDFDGTVSTKDTVNRLVRDHVTSPEWRHHMKCYLVGKIGSRQVYERMAPLMNMTVEQLDRFVAAHARLDPGFPAFLEWAKKSDLDVKILSDGFDATILTLFANHEITGIEIFSNRLEIDVDGAVTITSPYANPECGNCGTCKWNVIRQFRDRYERIILIGDGESDRHAAEEADLVLALKDLFVYCARRGIPALRVDGFEEIPRLLERRIEAVAFDMDGTLIDSIELITEAFNHMFARLGCPSMTQEEVARKTTLSLRDFCEIHLGADRVEEAVRIFRDYYDTVYLEKTRLMPGAAEALEALDGTVIGGIITNKRGTYARKIAEHLNLDRFMARIIGAQDGFAGKPSHEMFREFMRSQGSDPETTVYVGDTPIDIEASHNAGIDAFAVAGSIFSAEELALHRPRRVLGSIEELPNALKPLV